MNYQKDYQRVPKTLEILQPDRHQITQQCQHGSTYEIVQNKG